MVRKDVRYVIDKLDWLMATEKDEEKLDVLNHAKLYLLQYLDRINQDKASPGSQPYKSE